MNMKGGGIKTRHTDGAVQGGELTIRKAMMQCTTVSDG